MSLEQIDPTLRPSGKSPKLRKDEPMPVNDPSLTVDGFCKAEHMSRGKLYEMWKNGIGPDFYYAGVERRITQRARLRWQGKREAAARKAAKRG